MLKEWQCQKSKLGSRGVTPLYHVLLLRSDMKVFIHPKQAATMRNNVPKVYFVKNPSAMGESITRQQPQRWLKDACLISHTPTQNTWHRQEWDHLDKSWQRICILDPFHIAEFCHMLGVILKVSPALGSKSPRLEKEKPSVVVIISAASVLSRPGMLSAHLALSTTSEGGRELALLRENRRSARLFINTGSCSGN